MFAMSGHQLPKRATAGIAVMLCAAVLLGDMTSAHAQTPTAAIEPLPSASATEPAAPPTTSPALAPKPSAAPAPSPALNLAASTSVERDPVLFEQWWFWTGIAAITVTAMALVIVNSGSSPPAMSLGNRVAF